MVAILDGQDVFVFAASTAISPEHGGGQIILPTPIQSGTSGAWSLDLVVYRKQS